MTYAQTKNQRIACYYEQQLANLRAFALSRTGRTDVAEDLVQDTFKRLLTSDKMITEVTLPCLVYTVLRNLITDYWRHRRAVEEFEHFVATSSNLSATTVESIFNANEINRMLESGIASLPQSQQRIYRMNLFDGMAVSEISRTLNINYKSAENHLGAARRLVRSYIRQRLAI